MMNAKWSSFILIQEEIDMTKKVNEEITELQNILRENLTKGQALADFVKTLSKEALLGRRIADRTYTILKDKRWITKSHVTMTAQGRNAKMERDI